MTATESAHSKPARHTSFGFRKGVGWNYFTSSNSYGTVDDGCDSGYVQEYCLNGIGYQASEWRDHKPC